MNGQELVSIFTKAKEGQCAEGRQKIKFSWTDWKTNIYEMGTPVYVGEDMM